MNGLTDTARVWPDLYSDRYTNNPFKSRITEYLRVGTFASGIDGFIDGPWRPEQGDCREHND